MNFLIWFIILVIFIGMHHYLDVKRHLSYVNNPITWSIAYGLFSFCLVMTFPDRFNLFFESPTWYQVFILLALYLILVTYFIATKKRFSPVIKDFQRNKSRLVHNKLSLDLRYLTPKSFEIIAQQLLALLLVSFFLQAGLSEKAVIFTLPVTSGTLHLYAMKYYSIYYTFYVSCIAIIFGIVSMWVLFNFDNGIIYTYIIHWFYSIMTISLFLLFPRTFKKFSEDGKVSSK